MQGRQFCASTSDEPDDQNAKRNCEQARNAHDLFRHRENLGGKPFRKKRHATVDDPLNHQNEAEGNDEVIHAQFVAPMLGATAPGAGVAAAGAEPSAGRPAALPKKRKNSESGDRSIVVPVPSSAFVYAAIER